MKDLVETLLDAAIRAPSGDNTQPWHFTIDQSAGDITLSVDETRDPSPMNVKQLMSRLAVGAGAENVIRVARQCGCRVVVEVGSEPPVIRIHLQGGTAPATVDRTIVERVTNRRLYQGGETSERDLGKLAEQTPELDGVRAWWLSGRARIEALAALIGRADAMMFSEGSMRRAFVGNIRFDMPADCEVEQHLSLASLELSLADRLGLRLLRFMPDWLMHAGVKRTFASRARKLVESAAGLCVIAAPDDQERHFFNVGRVVQRAWLAATSAGLAVQPMMSVMILEQIALRGSASLQQRLGAGELGCLAADFRRLVPEIGPMSAAFLFRFGQAPPPSGRTGRLPWRKSAGA